MILRILFIAIVLKFHSVYLDVVLPFFFFKRFIYLLIYLSIYLCVVISHSSYSVPNLKICVFIQLWKIFFYYILNYSSPLSFMSFIFSGTCINRLGDSGSILHVYKYFFIHSVFLYHILGESLSYCFSLILLFPLLLNTFLFQDLYLVPCFPFFLNSYLLFLKLFKNN